MNIWLAIYRRFRASFIIVLAAVCVTAQAQTNVWTSSTSGNWEDASWSLGTLPGTNQTVSITNHGWKAVAIGPNTVLDFPQTLTIGSLNITSPGTDTVNTVMLNYAGFATPLSTTNIYIGTNAQLLLLQSALNGGMTVDGTVIQGAMSQVRGGVTISSAGAYYMTNGTFNGGDEYISGLFHQEGGSNYCLFLRDEGGHYELLGGDFFVGLEGAQIYGSVIQSGGTMNSSMWVGSAGIGSGYYELDGGMLRCPELDVPSSGNGFQYDSSSMVQAGGTNVTQDMEIGAQYIKNFDYPMGDGSYSLSDGVLATSGLAINGHGRFTQSGGLHSNTNLTITQSEFFYRQQPGADSYWVVGPGFYTLNGGAFTSDSVDLNPGVFSQNGGSSQITTLEVDGGLYSLFTGNYVVSGNFSLTGGGLVVSNIVLNGGQFTQIGGTVAQSGVLTLAGAGLTAGAGTQQFGFLQLSASGNTNSTFTLAPGPCAIRFANCSAMTWSNEPVLFVTNWNGSLSGGGLQQIFFGGDAGGLTAQQLAQIEFQNPAGVAPGLYPAVILPNGEIIPDPAATASKVIRPQLSLVSQSNGGMQVQLQGAAGRSYMIEVSSNLLNWTPWTNQFNTNGTLTLSDCDATNCPQRFYRAVLQP